MSTRRAAPSWTSRSSFAGLAIAGLAAAQLAAGCGKSAQSESEPEPSEPPVVPSSVEQAPREPAEPAQITGLPGAPPAGAHQGRHLWSKALGGVGPDAGRAVAVDPDGNVVVTGYFSESAMLGGGDAVPARLRDIYLAKFDAAGNHVWSRHFGGPGNDVGDAIAVDAKGNIVISGTFTESISLGGEEFVSHGKTDTFVARFDPQGNHLWSKSFGSEIEDSCAALAIHSDGSVALAGYFTSTVNYGGEDLVSAGQGDAFVARFSADGKHLWSLRFGDQLDDDVRSVALDAAGNLFVGGRFNGRIALGDTVLTSHGNSDALLARFTPDGRVVWAAGYGGPFNDFIVGITTDVRGHVTATGSYEEQIDFGGGALKAKGKKEVFIVKVAGGGQHLWSQSYGDTDDDVGAGIATDADGNLYATGWYWKSIDFGQGQLASAGDGDIWLLKLAPDGQPVWAQRFGGRGADFGRGIAVDGAGQPILIGTAHSGLNFGGGALPFTGPERRPPGDVVLAKFEK